MFATANLGQAIDHVKSGGVVAYPTETLWGLGCDAGNAKAVARVFEIKERPTHMPVSVLVSDVHAAEQIAKLTDPLRELLYQIWPAPITFVIEQLHDLPAGVGDGKFIGMRYSSDPYASELVKGVNVPLVTTSANKSGEETATEVEFLQWLPDDVLVYQPVTNLRSSKGSTIIKIVEQSCQVLRQGDFDLKELTSVARDFGFSVDAI